MIQIPNLTPRLRAAADMVRDGAYIADIGTDHAYLPIALCLEGRIRGGVASDINRGPVERGRTNINLYGLSDKLSVIQTDGLYGIECFAPDDIFILGMGGELIAKILKDAPWTKSGEIQLCLQPMTHPEILRAFLAEQGYSISDERIAAEDDRIYQLISAVYTGEVQHYTAAQLLLGCINIRRGGEAFERLVRKNIVAISRRIEGKLTAGEDVRCENAVIEELNSYL